MVRKYANGEIGKRPAICENSAKALPEKITIQD